MYDRTWIRSLQIDQNEHGWYLSWPDGSKFFPQFYKRAQDAKRARTMMIKSICT